MDLKKTQQLMAFTLFLSFLLSTTMARGSSIRRVAVLNMDEGAEDVAAFAELVESAISEQKEIDLLDRSTIDRILKEHELSLLNADQEVQRAVQTGQLLAVDLFLLLEKVVAHDQNQEHIRIRGGETKYGIKLADYVIAKPTAQELDSLATSIATRTVLLAEKARPDPDNVLLVAVSGFRDVQASLKLDNNACTLSRSLEASIESLLLQHPGIILLERQRTTPLTTERELVAELPEALRTSTVLIDGEYEIQHAAGTIAMTVRLSHSGQHPHIFEYEDRLGSVDELARRIVARITGEIEVGSELSVHNPFGEADLLFAQARVAETRFERLALADAAIALVPDSQAYQLRYLQEIIAGGYVFNTPLAVAISRSAQPVLDRMMIAQQERRSQPLNADQIYLIYSVMPLINPYRPPTRGTSDQHMGMVNREVWVALQMIREHRQGWYRALLSHHVSHAARIADPLAAMQALRALCEEAIEFEDFATSSILFPISIPSLIDGMEPERSIQIYAPLYEELANSPDPRLALAGKRGKMMMALYEWEYLSKDDFRKRYEDLESHLLEQVVRKYRSFNANGRLWLKQILEKAQFYDDAAKDLQYKADSEERIAEFVLEHKLVGDLNWFGSWPKCVHLLEQTGRPEDAVALFRRIIAQSRNVKGGKWVPSMEQRLDRLIQRHPHLARETDRETLDEQYAAAEMVPKDRLLGLGRAQRILVEEEILALIFEKGIVRLDKESLDVLAIDYAPAEAGYLLGSAVAEGQTIYAQRCRGTDDLCAVRERDVGCSPEGRNANAAISPRDSRRFHCRL